MSDVKWNFRRVSDTPMSWDELSSPRSVPTTVAEISSTNPAHLSPALIDDVVDERIECEDDEDGDKDVVDGADVVDFQQLTEMSSATHSRSQHVGS